jgi:hypothetical protein
MIEGWPGTSLRMYRSVVVAIRCLSIGSKMPLFRQIESLFRTGTAIGLTDGQAHF